jgi:trimeric autotransporter adhesin
VTFTATVSAQSGTPAGGTVTFFSNGVQIGSPVNLASQQAQITTSFATAGTYAVTATYSGAPGFAPSPTSNTVSQVVNNPAAAPTVTIDQANGQADPTNGSSVAFTVRFSETVTGFDGSDVAFTGSTVGGTLAAGVTGSGQDYTVTVTGMTGQGDVVVTIPAGAAVSGGGTSSVGSTSTDNRVKFDAVAPAVAINQAAGQADPTGTPSVKFDVTFSELVTGFTSADVSLAGSTAGGTLTANVTGSGALYTVTVTGMTTGGTVVASVPAGGATDDLNTSLASTSTDNSVTFFETGTVAFSKATFTGTEDADRPHRRVANFRAE